MKFQIDTESKVIKLTESVNLKIFIKTIKKLFPNNEWEDYTVETDVEVVWNNPIVIDRYNPYPNYPWITTYVNQTSPYSNGSQTFNVEVSSSLV